MKLQGAICPLLLGYIFLYSVVKNIVRLKYAYFQIIKIALKSTKYYLLRNEPSSFWTLDFIVYICLHQDWEWEFYCLTPPILEIRYICSNSRE